MPTLGGKKYKYDKAGMAAYYKALKALIKRKKNKVKEFPRKME